MVTPEIAELPAGDSAFESSEQESQIKRDLRTLKYTYHPLFDWRPYPSQCLPTITVNKHGLRSPELDDIIGKGSICAVIGGSFAWGFGASRNEATIPYLLQARLSRQESNALHLVNLADQAYNSLQEINTVAHTVGQLDISHIICVTGHNDIMAWLKNGSVLSRQHQELVDFFDWGSRHEIINEKSAVSKLTKIGKSALRQRPSPLETPFSPFLGVVPGPEIAMNLCANKIDVINAIAEANSIKVSYILQPTVFMKQNLAAGEKRIVEGKSGDLRERYLRNRDRLKDKFWNDGEGGDIAFVDSGEFFDECRGQLYMDYVHVSDRGYELWCDRLFEELQSIDFFDRRR